MLKKFEVLFLDNAMEFIESIDIKTQKKLFANVEKAQYLNDPKLFKKLNNEIWEFRCESFKLQYRLLAFWDKRDNKNTLVICTHGFIKKVDKVPEHEIEKAKHLRKLYLES